MRTTSLASVGRIRRSTTLASMMRLLPGNPDILTPEYQMDYISVSQHFSTLSPSGFACHISARSALRASLVSISGSAVGKDSHCVGAPLAFSQAHEPLTTLHIADRLKC